jgi:uncharacterized lipoprotein
MRLLSVLLLGMLLGACALSPQEVALHPVATIGVTQNIGHNKPLLVVGKDVRKSVVIGTRGSTYAETSLIRASNKVAEDLASQVRQNLQSRGFNTFNAPSGSPELQVQLVSLDYTPASGYIINRILVDASIQALLKKADGSTFTRLFSSSITFRQPWTPSADKNQAMLNDVLSRCLTKLLEDPLLMEQLAGGK